MANIITLTRIIFSISLPFIKKNNLLFLLLYTICGLTDILDGYIARKTKTESSFGAKFDTIADLIFFIIIFIVMFDIILKNIINLQYCIHTQIN